jgi:hypothetical protein
MPTLLVTGGRSRQAPLTVADVVVVGLPAAAFAPALFGVR